ncbi:MAG: CD1845 family protein [Christensenellales bacterium]
MKFILKILLAPLMLILWIIECICKLVLKLSSIVFLLVSILFVIASIYHFVNGSTLNGCIGLVIAFLISPYGLPKLAVKLLAGFIVMRMLFKEKVYG